MLLPVDWDKNGLLTLKRLHMLNKLIVYSQARTNVNSIQYCTARQANICSMCKKFLSVDLEAASTKR